VLLHERRRNPRPLGRGGCQSGINTVLLWQACEKQQFGSNDWLNFDQAKELGGWIKKGSKGTTGYYYSPHWYVDKVTGQKKEVARLTPYVLFNVHQIEGLPLVEKPKKARHYGFIEKVENLLEFSHANLCWGLQRAFYCSFKDVIYLPKRTAFKSPADFYATVINLFIRWTGHEARLNRVMGASLDELVTELGSAFLCAELGLEDNFEHAPSSCVDSWVQILQEDSRAIFRASSLATKAHHFLKNFIAPLAK
jgi:antirestriction protein ArdC